MTAEAPAKTERAKAVRLLEGPAGGHAVFDDRPVIWVAVLDDAVHVLSDRADAAADLDVLLRVRGAWQKYQWIKGPPPAYRWVKNPPRE